MNKTNYGDYLRAFISFVIVLVFLGIEFFTPSEQINQTTNFLIETIKLSSTLSFAWYTQKILARQEYLRNLKERAVSAYRRITDLKSSISILRVEIDDILSHDSKIDQKSLETLRIAANLIQITAESSVADWGDIIGEEIKIARTVDQLRKEEAELLLSSRVGWLEKETEEKLAKIREEIGNLKDELPLALQVNATEEALPREGRFDKKVEAHFFISNLRQGGIYLQIPKVQNFPEGQGPYKLLVAEPGMSKLFLLIADGNDSELGHVINPLGDEVYYKDFVVTLLYVLQAMGKEVKGNIEGSETYEVFTGLEYAEDLNMRDRLTFKIPA